MTQEGIPIAHEIFPGNLNDVQSFAKALDVVKERFNIDKIILVGDRGMASAPLLEEIAEQHLEYIVGVRMRKIRAMDDVLSRRGRYHEIKANLKVKEVRRENERYIVCFNPEEAEDDRQSRERMLAKLDKKLKSGGIKPLVGNTGYRHFLFVSGGKIAIDEEAVNSEARYDGKYVIKTNDYELSPEEVALAYKDLWWVERSFRELKLGLDLHPVYVYKDSRVRGHVMICFLALVLESAFRKNCREKGIKIPYNDLLLDLKQVRAFELKLNNKHYLLRSALSARATRRSKQSACGHPARSRSCHEQDSTLSEFVVVRLFIVPTNHWCCGFFQVPVVKDEL
jgi:transposase